MTSSKNPRAYLRNRSYPSIVRTHGQESEIERDGRRAPRTRRRPFGNSRRGAAQALEKDLLRAVIESFVLREGTDYGERELSLDDKVRRVERLLERGDARIVFDPRTESVDVVTKERRV